MASPVKTKEPQLTPRQRDILRLIVKGQRMKEIATNLGLSTHTVEGHQYEMMEALGGHVYCRACAVCPGTSVKGPSPYFFGPLPRVVLLSLKIPHRNHNAGAG